ncbi:glycosyltransferase family 25 protein [Campylobacter concisus]|uniref:glycosyltransferase family 25 protein n=1 Tax=Campylobacter concisus TaxID=199 RepID=UPI000CD9E1F0|nr:glycosyltransferase family 25 protein [Campylobacter concisus]
MNYPIYVISLKRDEERRQNLQKQFNRYDEFKIIDAVDAKNFSVNEYYKAMIDCLLKSCDEKYKFKIPPLVATPGELACTMSHIKAYEDFLQSDAEFTLILEDDVIGNDELINEAFLLCKDIGRYSILICGVQDGLNSRFRAFGKKIKENLYLISPYSYSSIYRTAAYILTRKSAKSLLDFYKDGLYGADKWEAILRNTELKMYFSNIFSHPDELNNSTLEMQRKQKEKINSLFKKYNKNFSYKVSRFYEKHIAKNEKIFTK